jgi:hypothetical protein
VILQKENSCKKSLSPSKEGSSKKKKEKEQGSKGKNCETSSANTRA